MSAAVLFAAATAFVLGARHGLDWDHLTAIADLVGPTEGRRRSFALALWYCVGHGSVILLLGILVGLVGVRLPEGLDRVFEAIAMLAQTAGRPLKAGRATLGCVRRSRRKSDPAVSGGAGENV